MNFLAVFLILTWVKRPAVLGAWWGESCPHDETSTHGDLQEMMENKLFGQHIVLKTVPSVIKNHLAKHDPKKALVISMHGSTGIGKTYVTELIADYIYGSQGSKSPFVHTFLGEDFRDPRKLEDYKKLIKDKVVSSTELCGRSLFIFSEIETMMFGVLDVLKPYLDYSKYVDKVNYRKHIFIFLSNIGGGKIEQVTVENMRSGAPRSSISRRKLEEVLSQRSLMTGGFEKNHLILSGLVDFFVPFLPLERFHVQQCVLEELRSRGGGGGCGGAVLEVVELVSDEVVYGNNSLATHGCKMIDKKVDMLF